jgi:hypothetical protein
MKTSKLFTLVICSFFFFGNITFSQNHIEQKKDIKTALSSGEIKLSLTGLEGGMKLSIKVEKENAKPLILFIPKGASELKIGNADYQKIEISTQQEVKIDLSKIMAQTVVVIQSSKQKLIKGTIIIDNDSGSTTYDYQNATVGVK